MFPCPLPGRRKQHSSVLDPPLLIPSDRLKHLSISGFCSPDAHRLVVVGSGLSMVERPHLDLLVPNGPLSRPEPSPRVPFASSDLAPCLSFRAMSNDSCFEQNATHLLGGAVTVGSGTRRQDGQVKGRNSSSPLEISSKLPMPTFGCLGDHLGVPRNRSSVPLKPAGDGGTDNLSNPNWINTVIIIILLNRLSGGVAKHGNFPTSIFLAVGRSTRIQSPSHETS